MSTDIDFIIKTFDEYLASQPQHEPATDLAMAMLFAKMRIFDLSVGGEVKIGREVLEWLVWLAWGYGEISQGRAAEILCIDRCDFIQVAIRLRSEVESVKWEE